MEAEMNPITPDAEAIFIELGKLDSHSWGMNLVFNR
jgi:hypothetical protein